MTHPPALKRHLWRHKIIPFGHVALDQKRFPVGWNLNLLTFEEITDTLRPHILKDLLYFRKIKREYIGDLLQQGWLRLWQAFQEDFHLLEKMTVIKASNFVTNRCGSTQLRDYLKRYDSYHVLSNWSDPDADIFEESITDIVIGSSLTSTQRIRHAQFTRTTDRLVDVERAIHQVVVWCDNDIRKLAALYYLTTSVNQTDAGRIAGLPIKKQKDRKPRCHQMQHWCKIVLAQLQKTLGNYKPFESNKNAWKDCIKAGNVQPMVDLAHKYANQSDRLLALYALTTRVARQTIVDELGVNDSALWYAMKQVRQELRCSYARRVPMSA